MWIHKKLQWPVSICFSAHLYGAYAISLALTVIRRPSFDVCVRRKLPEIIKISNINIWCKYLSCSWIVPPR